MKEITVWAIAWAIMWVAVSAAVIASIILTGRLVGMWAFLIPSCVNISTRRNEE